MALRQIVLDTETTGLSWEAGHRVIEIGCIELIDRKLTHNNFHAFINPERAVDAAAEKVHGISSQFLSDKPLFAELAQELYDYLQGAEIIAHNASFDVGFLDNEFRLCESQYTAMQDFATIIDTLMLARKLHPRKRNSLDALCKRYNINTVDRTFHGALKDAKILVDVYLAMTSGQGKLEFGCDAQDGSAPAISNSGATPNKIIYADSDELALHQKLLDLIQ